MSLGFVEILALIVAVVTITKLLFVIVNPKSWMNVVKPFYSKPMLTSIIALILSAVVLYYLINAGITIVQIFAVMALVALLACMTISIYSKEMFAMADKMLKDKSIMRKAWLPLLVWLVLAIWVIWTVLF